MCHFYNILQTLVFRSKYTRSPSIYRSLDRCIFAPLHVTGSLRVCRSITKKQDWAKTLWNARHIANSNHLSWLYPVTQNPSDVVSFPILNWIKWKLTFDDSVDIWTWLKFILNGPPSLFIWTDCACSPTTNIRCMGGTPVRTFYTELHI